jgi:hypothetical protein
MRKNAQLCAFVVEALRKNRNLLPQGMAKQSTISSQKVGIPSKLNSYTPSLAPLGRFGSRFPLAMWTIGSDRSKAVALDAFDVSGPHVAFDVLSLCHPQYVGVAFERPKKPAIIKSASAR